MDTVIEIDLMSAKLEDQLDRHPELEAAMRTSLPLRRAMGQAAAIAREYLGQRFDVLSAGGADELGDSWAPLKDKVAAAKSRSKRGRSRKSGRFTPAGDHGILKGRTGMLRDVFDQFPGPGYYEDLDQAELKVTIGYGGDAQHADDGATVAEIASYQHNGTHTIPARELVVIPPQSVINDMQEPVEMAMDDIAAKYAKQDVDKEVLSQALPALLMFL